MSKTQDTGEQIKFLVSCIHNASGGKPNFQAVADQLGIVSKAAAQKRYERLLKAYGVGASNKATAKGDEAPTKAEKRKAPARGAGKANNKKAKKEPDSEEDVKPLVKKEKAASPSGSELSDPLASGEEA